MSDRLYRSRDDRVISGVAGGLAAQLDVDPSIIRVAWVLVTLLSGGIGLVVYIVMAIVVPQAPPGWPGPRPSPSGAMPTEVPAGGWLAPTGEVVAHAGDGPAGAGGGPTSAGQATGASYWTAPPARPASRGDGGRGIGIAIGLLLVVLGGLALIRQVLPDVDLGSIWPVACIVFGLLLVVLSVRPGRRA